MADGPASTRDLVFISYSHADEPPWLQRLRIILKPYVRAGKLQEWSDPYIQVGDTWRREINTALARTRIGVCLVSPNFLASDFIAEEEVPPLLRAAERGDLKIVAVLISSVDLDITPFAHLQWGHDPKTPLDMLGEAERNAALVRIVKTIAGMAGTARMERVTAESAVTEVVTPARKGDFNIGSIGGNASFSAGGDIVAGDKITQAAININVGSSRDGPQLPPSAPRAIEGLAKLHGVPLQKPNFVPRDADLARVKGRLLAGDGGAVGITGSRPGDGGMAIGLHGMGGIGKTELAVALAHDDAVRGAFPDGIFWLTLGQTPDLLPLQASLWRMAGGGEPAFADVGGGQRALLDLFKEKTALIVLDDIWRVGDAAPLAVAGARGRVLTTTRDASLLTALGAAEVSLNVLGEVQALQLLANWSGENRDTLPEAAKDVAAECGHLPLALALAGAQVKDGLGWADVLAALKQGDLEFLDHPYGSVFKSLRASVEALAPDDAARYGELAVALEDVALPVAVVGKLWRKTAGLADHESRKLLQTFANKALLTLSGDGEAAAVSFHDLQYDFLRLNADDPRAPHAALLDAYRDEIGAAADEFPGAWARLPRDDPYLWPRLADHLLAAGLEDELRGLLLDYRWLAAKLTATDMSALLADFDRLTADADLRLIQQALHLSSHVLLADPTQLAGQLVGRLRDSERLALKGMIASAMTPGVAHRLIPMTASLVLPGGPLIRTLSRGSSGGGAIAPLPDGIHVLWEYNPNHNEVLLELWSLTTGDIVRTLGPFRSGSLGEASLLAVAANGRRLLLASGSGYGPLIIVDIETGEEVCTLMENGRATSILVMADARLALTGHADGSLRRWNVENGALDSVLQEADGKEISFLGLLEGGATAVAVNTTGTLKIFNMESKKVIHTAQLDKYDGHGRTNILLKNSEILSIDNFSGTFNIYSIDTGKIDRRVRRRFYDVEHGYPWTLSAAVFADCRYAILGFSKGTLAVFDLRSGELIQTFAAHNGIIWSIAMLPSGEKAVTSSTDGTLKIWNFGRDIQNHRPMAIKSLIISPDRIRMLLGAADASIQFFDKETWREIWKDEESYWIRPKPLAFSPDSKFALLNFDGSLVILNLDRLEQVKQLDVRRVEAATFLKDGRHVILSFENSAFTSIYDTLSGERVGPSMRGHGRRITCFALLPDGSRMVSGSDDGTLKMWDLSGPLEKWSIENRQEIRTLGIGTRADWEAITSVAVLSDGIRALSGSADCTIKLWNLNTGELVRTLVGHRRQVQTVAVLDDGRRAVSASLDSTVKVWDLETGQILGTFTADARVSCLGVGVDSLIVAGDLSGAIHFLRLIE